MSRQNSREAVMQLVYEHSFGGDAEANELKDFVKYELTDDELEYVQHTSDEIAANLSEIDKLISENLRNWTIDRISRVDLSVLRVAVYEMLYATDVPVPIVISEAIRITRKYSNETSCSFVNGILGTINRKRCSGSHEGSNRD